MKIEPHGLYEVWSPDQVAEALDGVSIETSNRLWEVAVPLMPKRTSEVPDDFDQRCLAKCGWSKLTAEEQTELNRVAEQHETKWRSFAK